MNNKLIGISATLISAIYFGFIPLLMRTVYSLGANTLTVSLLRFLLAVIPCYIYLKLKGVDLSLTREEIIKIVVVTVFGYGGTTALLFGAYNFIPSGMATTIHFLYPTFTVLGTIVFFKGDKEKKKIICAVLSLVGVILFYNGDDIGNIEGMLLALLSSMTYAFYTIYLGKSILKDLNPIKLIFYMNIVASLMYTIITLGFSNFTFDLPIKAYLILIVTSILTTFVGVLGYQIGVKHIGHENTAILSTFEPITSVVVGFIAYNEEFNLKGIIGIILILLSTIITSKNVENKKAEP